MTETRDSSTLQFLQVASSLDVFIAAFIQLIGLLLHKHWPHVHVHNCTTSAVSLGTLGHCSLTLLGHCSLTLALFSS